MIFHVVAVGKLRDPNVRALCEEYAGRSNRYNRLQIHEVPNKAAKSKTREGILREEAIALLKAVPADARLVALARSGDRCDSSTFSARLKEWRQSGRDLAFVIGGAYGLDDRVRQRCDLELSLSDMTFPHEMARLMLLEQIYRANTILKGEPYHKGA